MIEHKIRYPLAQTTCTQGLQSVEGWPQLADIVVKRFKDLALCCHCLEDTTIEACHKLSQIPYFAVSKRVTVKHICSSIEENDIWWELLEWCRKARLQLFKILLILTPRSKASIMIDSPFSYGVLRPYAIIVHIKDEQIAIFESELVSCNPIALQRINTHRP